MVLAGLLFFLALFAPVYFRNLQLQNFVSNLGARRDAASLSDDVLRTWVLDKAHALDLPVKRDNVTITHEPEGRHIEVRYQVDMNLPGYSVKLHFYPAAGSP